MKIKVYLKNSNTLVFIYFYCKQLLYKFMFKNIKQKEKFIEKKFKKCLGYDIDFKKYPITFNQKIQFRKLYDSNSLYSICSDKYKVRKYVREKIGEEYLIPIYLVTERLTMEQWEQLPDSFVAKANHNSGPVQIIKDKSKTDAKRIIKELNNQLKIDYGILSMEKYYSDIPRKIIVEKYLKNDIEDYKIHCFNNGKMFIDICTRDTGETKSVLYDIEWNNLKVTAGNLNDRSFKKPKNFYKMLDIAKKLSEDFDYVRVDLYNISGNIYFGELTFCENSGFGKFSDETWDYNFGQFWL
ncbi:ATP-grasp fold amidoligase family protein [uncultured Fusobacterium sp.]|uniref:ATP-grasp fold amidoligase family protein n=1 Tax=uncultured Fusobacterium sp. TaxID=159267 RepID=UPI002585A039|nr:ATP-grasp fold amidoligase family protein [uncultured Fusobacterium sp.]